LVLGILVGEIRGDLKGFVGKTHCTKSPPDFLDMSCFTMAT
jgi:hypothetical protein